MAGEVLERLPESAHHSIYDACGAPLYHRLTENDATEVPELLRRLRGHEGPVLELACGSGRLTLPLLEAGFDVTALDLSPAMIELVTERVPALPAGPRIGRLRALVADMSAFELPERFGCVVLGTTSITLLDEAARASCFACVRRHLRPGGLFLLSAMDVASDGREPSESSTPLPGRSGELLEYLDPAAGRRWTSIVLSDDAGTPRELFSSSMRLLPTARLIGELAGAGLELAGRHAIDLGPGVTGREDVLLELNAVGAREKRPAAVAELFVAPSRFGDPSRRAIRAEGTTVHFADGSNALCGTSGLWNVNLGYGNAAVSDAIAAATRDASYLTLFRHGHEYADRSARALIDVAAPHIYDRVLFATAGGAAVDAAIKIARQHAQLAGQPERRLVVGLRGSFHGMTFGAHGLAGEDLGQAAYGIDQRLVRHVHHADPREITRLLRAQGDSIAAVVLEPMLGSGAHVVAPEVVDVVLRGREEHNYLVVADEVATGFGRTGPMFASHGWTAQPDLLVTSKGLTNGTCAASAVLWSPRVSESFDRSDAILIHGETQAGAPPSCAAIEATIAEFARLDALRSGRRVAARLDRWLDELAAETSAVAAVRGAGCFRAIELREPDGAAFGAERIEQVVTGCKAAGAIVHPGPSAIQLIPALTYDEDDIDRLLDRVAATLRRV
jgi:adenosylmethionine-8-amino-7-oxononanoate aminotransferase/SAM-dependent methyltransferase